MTGVTDGTRTRSSRITTWHDYPYTTVTVGRTGIEPVTFALSGRCSHQLS